MQHNLRPGNLQLLESPQNSKQFFFSLFSVTYIRLKFCVKAAMQLATNIIRRRQITTKVGGKWMEIENIGHEGPN